MRYPYQNANLTIRERVADLLSRMSIQEKIGQVNQHLYGWESFTDEKRQEFTEKFKNHVEWGGGLGALYGLFRADPWSKVNYSNGVLAKDSWKVANRVQKYVIEHSRWQIPALIVEECPHGHQGLDGISYPTNIGRGNSFNTDLMQQSAQLMKQELALKGVNLALVSTLDLVKDPRWGRSEECFGEDPKLAAKMTEAIVAGFQEDLIQKDVNYLDQTVSLRENKAVGVVLKHCIAQGEALGGHNSGTVTIGMREYSDIYRPLLSSVKQAAGVMAAYNDVDGVPCHINQELLKTQLRQEVGFQGIVMADGVALDRLEDVFDSKATAAAAALKAGVDLSLWDQTYMQINEAIQERLVDLKALDQAVAHVLGLKFLLGLFDDPYLEEPEQELAQVLKQSEKLNLKVAQESITLVKNSGILPLDQTKKKIAVIGPNADNIYHLLGDYTAPQSSQRQQETIYQQIKQTFPNAQVTYAQGCEVRAVDSSYAQIEHAMALAKDADIIVVVLGGSSARNFDMEFLSNGAVSSKGINMDSGENVDVASLKLGGQQLSLLTALKQLKKPIISILIQGRPYELTTVQEVSDAVLIGWFPGQKGAQAIADTLSGNNNPSGRLSISYPLNSQQLPVYYYQRDASKQENYYDQPGAPLYSFGTGLSYTTFEYDNLQVKTAVDKIVITVNMKNNGVCAGQESTLLFAKLKGGHVIQRTKLLKAFQKNWLEPKQQQKLTFVLPKSEFEYMDIDHKIKQASKVTFMIDKLTIDIAW